MTWLNTPIPIYQLLLLLTIYVIYKELVKLGLKQLIKLNIKRRQRNEQLRQVLEVPEDVHT